MVSSSSVAQEFDRAGSLARRFRLRKRILDISQTVSALHIAGAFSCMEIVETMYFHLMRNPRDRKNGDTFLMSKGHGCMAQYVALEELGVLSTEDLDTYCKKGGRLGVHPDYGNPGIEASTGSLGHGLSLAVGMSYGDLLAGSDRRVFVVLSDGEMQEGSTWEALLLAPSIGVKNVVACVDMNDFQSLGRTSEIHPNFYPLDEKIRAFGWETDIIDGHEPAAIYERIQNRKGDRPLMLACRTIKGKGVSFMESVPIWHYRAPSPEEYQRALKEITAGASQG